MFLSNLFFYTFRKKMTYDTNNFLGGQSIPIILFFSGSNLALLKARLPTFNQIWLTISDYHMFGLRGPWMLDVWWNLLGILLQHYYFQAFWHSPNTRWKKTKITSYYFYYLVNRAQNNLNIESFHIEFYLKPAR